MVTGKAKKISETFDHGCRKRRGKLRTLKNRLHRRPGCPALNPSGGVLIAFMAILVFINWQWFQVVSSK